MIVDLIDKLISRSIDLIRETEKRNRDIFTDFVEPLFQCFESVHKDYTDTFKKVHEYVKGSNPNNYAEIGLMLQDDSLFTTTNRLKLLSLAKSQKPKIIKEFVGAIENYLNGSFYLVYGEEGNGIDEFIEKGNQSVFMNNRARSALWSRIERGNRDLPAKEKKQKYLTIIEQFLREFQESYSKVVFEYGKLKNELLNTKL